MSRVTIDGASFSALAGALAPLLIAGGGLLLIMQVRRWGGRVLLAGICAALIAGFFAHPGQTVPWRVALACAALILAALRQWGLAFVLATPWLRQILLQTVFAAMPAEWIIVLGVALAVGAAARLLVALLGRVTAGRLLGTYTVRVVETILGAGQTEPP